MPLHETPTREVVHPGFMTAWAALLIPAGSAAFGGLAGAGSAIWAKIVTHRSTDARERAARRETLKIKRFESERETLLALQDAVHRLHQIVDRAQQSPKFRVSPELAA